MVSDGVIQRLLAVMDQVKHEIGHGKFHLTASEYTFGRMWYSVGLMERCRQFPCLDRLEVSDQVGGGVGRNADHQSTVVDTRGCPEGNMSSR
jgi:hypothetical protein